MLKGRDGTCGKCRCRGTGNEDGDTFAKRICFGREKNKADVGRSIDIRNEFNSGASEM